MPFDLWSWIWESGALLPLAALVFMGVRWWTRGRDPDPRSVTVRYEPPDGLTPAEVGVLMDGAVKMRHLTATLLDLEARGHLEIEEVEPPPDASDDRDFVIRPRSAPAAWDDLHVHERRILHTLFTDADDWTPEGRGIERVVLSLCAGLPGRDEVRMSELDDLPWFLVTGAGFTHRVAYRGYFPRAPGTVRLRYVAAAATLFLLGAAAASTPPQYLSVGLAAVVVGVVGRFMPHRTEEGARVAEGAAGFRKFLARVEGRRLREMVAGPDEFDRYLAYAAALNVENEWTSTFHDIYAKRVQKADGSSERSRNVRDGGEVKDLPTAMVEQLFSGRTLRDLLRGEAGWGPDSRDRGTDDHDADGAHPDADAARPDAGGVGEERGDGDGRGE